MLQKKLLQMLPNGAPSGPNMLPNLQNIPPRKPLPRDAPKSEPESFFWRTRTSPNCVRGLENPGFRFHTEANTRPPKGSNLGPCGSNPAGKLRFSYQHVDPKSGPRPGPKQRQDWLKTKKKSSNIFVFQASGKNKLKWNIRKWKIWRRDAKN